jgi:hypothetical protein
MQPAPRPRRLTTVPTARGAPDDHPPGAAAEHRAPRPRRLTTVSDRGAAAPTTTPPPPQRRRASPVEIPAESWPARTPSGHVPALAPPVRSGQAVASPSPRVTGRNSCSPGTTDGSSGRERPSRCPVTCGPSGGRRAAAGSPPRRASSRLFPTARSFRPAMASRCARSSSSPRECRGGGAAGGGARPPGGRRPRSPPTAPCTGPRRSGRRPGPPQRRDRIQSASRKTGTRGRRAIHPHPSASGVENQQVFRHAIHIRIYGSRICQMSCQPPCPVPESSAGCRLVPPASQGDREGGRTAGRVSH